MYTYEFNPGAEAYSIYDPDGTYICEVSTEEEAEGLLSHLNR